MSRPRRTKFQRTLNAAARGGAAAAHKCRLLAAQFGGVHAIVEGSDDRPFYEPFISATYGTSNIFFHVAEGRSEVLHARSIMPASFPLADRLLFVIDRDFDGVLPAPPAIPSSVFTTCFYSVESYFISEEALRTLFSTHGNIDWSSKFAAETVASFKRLTTCAAEKLRFAMAISVAARAKNAVANLNNVRMSSLVKIDAAGNLELKENFLSTFVRQANIDTRTISRAEIRSALASMQTQDPRLWIRGKYLLTLFVDFVRARYREASNLKKAKDPEFKHARTRVALPADDLMSMCSGHLSCPPALAAYLMRV